LWLYNPEQSKNIGQELFRGLAGPITGPVWVINVNATRAVVNTVYEARHNPPNGPLLTWKEAEENAYADGYTIPVGIAPIS